MDAITEDAMPPRRFRPVRADLLDVMATPANEPNVIYAKLNDLYVVSVRMSRILEAKQDLDVTAEDIRAARRLLLDWQRRLEDANAMDVLSENQLQKAAANLEAAERSFQRD